MKLRLISILAFIALFISTNLEIFAQQGSSGSAADPLTPISTKTKIYVGVLGGYNRSVHTANLASFADDDLCPYFADGSNNGFFGGLFYELPLGEITDSKHTIIGKVILNTFPASFEHVGEGYTSLVKDASSPSGYKPIFSETKHTLEIDYSTLTVEILYRWNVAYGIGVCVGPVFDVPMTKNKTQKYMLIRPIDVQFQRPDNWQQMGLNYEDNDRTIIVHDGEIDEASSLRLGLKFGIEYEILTGSMFDIIPGVYYNLGLTKVSSKESDWTINAIQAGVGIRFAL